MGVLIEGKWKDIWYSTKRNKGEFVREDATFRNQIKKKQTATFPAVAGRYHLFLSPACPWCHRVMIFLKLKGLDKIISSSLVKPEMLENGWELEDVTGASFLKNRPIKYIYQLYLESMPGHSGRATVPVLWDKKTNQIVNNESSEIIRMFNTEFNEFSDHQQDYYPEKIRDNIDELNAFIYHNINNGVYRCGFATTQTAYDQAVTSLFESLEKVEKRLSNNRYLLGNEITESDWRLFPTLIRFDLVYYVHFKANIKKISEYPNLFNYMLDLYQQPDIAETVDWFHIKKHYYYSHKSINPHRIVPAGPEFDYFIPHDRLSKIS